MIAVLASDAAWTVLTHHADPRELGHRDSVPAKTATGQRRKQCDPKEIAPAIAPLLIADEHGVAAFKAMRDFVVFTNKRLIAVNVQGMSGKKRDFASLPYSKIQAFSIETAGTFDLDAELDLWFSGLGKVRLEFKGNADIRQLGQTIATYVL